MIFWDTSAFARAFLPDESGHEHARNLLMNEPRNAGSALLWPETTSALLRRARARGSKKGFDVSGVRTILESFEIVDFNATLAAAAFEFVDRFLLSGSDAAHLATAVALARRAGRRWFTFATSDVDQAAAARWAGLRTVTPGV
ncbi:MAG: type II toxin-antitoxin system VapC family toxin [Planctomycetes bacterium]|nr:type II toxin-antitoxin system VapC family toxin [Planctomycetota bacterium]